MKYEEGFRIIIKYERKEEIRLAPGETKLLTILESEIVRIDRLTVRPIEVAALLSVEDIRVGVRSQLAIKPVPMNAINGQRVDIETLMVNQPFILLLRNQSGMIPALFTLQIEGRKAVVA